MKATFYFVCILYTYSFLYCDILAEHCEGVSLEFATDKLKEFAHTELAEPWDNVGLLIEPTKPQVIKTILATIDLTENVMDEALSLGANLIIVYHPLIFPSLKRITRCKWKERVISRCLANNIAVFSPHTSWDIVHGGVNDWLASAFKCREVKPLNHSDSAKPSKISEVTGVGRICQLDEPIRINEAVDRVKKHLGIPFVQLAVAADATHAYLVHTIAFAAGSGGSLLRNIKCDLKVTGECSHHDILDSIHEGSSVILTHHSNSERGFLLRFKELFTSMLACPGVQITVSKEDIDPLTIV